MVLLAGVQEAAADGPILSSVLPFPLRDVSLKLWVELKKEPFKIVVTLPQVFLAACEVLDAGRSFKIPPILSIGATRRGGREAKLSPWQLGKQFHTKDVAPLRHQRARVL